MKKIALLLTIGFALTFTSCKKDKVENPVSKPNTMEELQVPASFNWKTTKDISLTLTGNGNGLVEVANATGVAYQKAYLSSGVAYTMKLTVPSYEKTVQLKFLGQTASLELTANVLQYQFN
jgi:hypothetical protein